MIRYSKEEREKIAAAKAIVKARAQAKAPKVERPKKLHVDPVVMPARFVPSAAQKAQLHREHHGLCWWCREPVPVDGPEVQYDHKKARMFRGADTMENMGPIHTVPCHAKKTAAELSGKGKADRRRKKHNGEAPPARTTIQSAGFQPGYRPLPSRPFNTRREP